MVLLKIKKIFLIVQDSKLELDQYIESFKNPKAVIQKQLTVEKTTEFLKNLGYEVTLSTLENIDFTYTLLPTIL